MTAGCYLLHFAAPICPSHPCRHYLGWSDDLERRIAEHRAGQGARLTAVAKERGITFTVVRIWTGATRSDERRLKNRKSGPKLCPICGRHHEQMDLLLDTIDLDQLDELAF
jgi:predicted GIY-YIG superfamily endonuclease